jgi:hypothetical protein
MINCSLLTFYKIKVSSLVFLREGENLTAKRPKTWVGWGWGGGQSSSPWVKGGTTAWECEYVMGMGIWGGGGDGTARGQPVDRLLRNVSPPPLPQSKT